MYLPNQRLSDSQKVEQFGSITEWGREVINSLLNVAGFSAYGAIDYYDMQTNLDLYNGLINKNDVDYVTNPYGMQNAKFPAQLENYNIIKPKIDLLVGEEIKRPFNFKVISVSPDAVSSIEKTKQELVMQTLNTILTQELFVAGHVPDQNDVPEGQVMTPEQIDEYIKTNYSDMREILGQQALNYLLWYCDLKNKFNKGFKKYLITGCELYYNGIVSGEPTCLSVDERHFYAELASDSSYVEDAQYCYYQRFLTPSDIYDEFYETLTEEDIAKIEDIKNGKNYLTIADSNLGIPITYADVDMSSKGIYNNHALIRVVHCCWQGLRRVGFLTYIDSKTDQEQETIVDETYKPNKEMGEKVEWKWINEVWEGTKIGPDIFVNIRPIPNQSKSLDNPSKCKLPYCGVFKHNPLVSIMKPHQYFYDILMYRLQLSIARAKDKIMVMDIAQIPRSMGIDTEKWMYYLDTLGIAFINSFEEGSGKFAGKTSAFNQFQSVDMSLANVMNQYIEMLSKVEDMIGEISGVSRQRQGQVQTSELVGNVERSVVQSSHITEPLFYTHGEVKRRCLTNLLEVAKIAWINGKKAQYVMDDLSRVYFNIDGPEFADAEFGIFISNSSKDDKIIQTMQALAQAAVQAGTVGLKDIAEILSTDSIANIKKKLGEAEERQHKKQMELEQQKQQGKQQQLQLQLQDKEADRQVMTDNNVRDNETKLEIAHMSKQQPIEDKSQELANDLVKHEKELQIKREKNLLDHSIDKESVNIDRKTADQEAKIREEELKIDKDKVAHEKKMKEKELVVKKTAARNKPKASK